MRRARWVLLGLSVAAAAAFAALWVTRPRSLLDRAQTVANLGGFWEQHVWLTDHSFLLTHDGNHGYRVLYVDLASGVKTRMPGLEAALSSFNQEGIVPSTDGKRLLCLPFDGEPDTRVLDLHGSILQKVDVGGNLDLCWEPGTYRWLDVGWPNTSSSSGHPPDRTLVVREAEVGRKGWLRQWRGDVPNDQSGAREALPTVCARPGELICMSLSGRNGGDANPVPERIESQALHLTPERVGFDSPTAFRVEDLVEDKPFAVSPAGDKVAWIAESQRTSSAIVRLLSRLLPTRFASTYTDCTLWTSATNGRGRRAVASCSVDHEEDAPDHLTWLTGGKAVSFGQGGKLWRLDLN